MQSDVCIQIVITGLYIYEVTTRQWTKKKNTSLQQHMILIFRIIMTARVFIWFGLILYFTIHHIPNNVNDIYAEPHLHYMKPSPKLMAASHCDKPCFALNTCMRIVLGYWKNRYGTIEKYICKATIQQWANEENISLQQHAISFARMIFTTHGLM